MASAGKRPARRSVDPTEIFMAWCWLVFKLALVVVIGVIAAAVVLSGGKKKRR